MTNERLQQHIDLMNNKKLKYITEEELSLNVIKITLFDNIQDITTFDSGTFGGEIELEDMYFIFDDDFSVVVGVVYDMQSDLHWYIDPKYRERGYLTKALHECIFNDVINERVKIEKENIYITIENNNLKSKKIAESLAFKKDYFCKKRNSEVWKYKIKNKKERI